jgi:hypothetical protein
MLGGVLHLVILVFLYLANTSRGPGLLVLEERLGTIMNHLSGLGDLRFSSNVSLLIFMVDLTIVMVTCITWMELNLAVARSRLKLLSRNVVEFRKGLIVLKKFY